MYGPNGILYVADTGVHKVRAVRPDGSVTTVAGGTPGDVDATGSAARFGEIAQIAVGPDGAVYVTEWGKFRIRRIT